MRSVGNGRISKITVLVSLVMAVATSTGNAAENKTAREVGLSKSPSTTLNYTASTLLGKIGITSARPVNDSDLAKLKIKNGLILESVDGSSALAGVQPGDILISINGRDTRFGTVNELPNNFPTVIVLLVIREDERLPIAVQLPPRKRTVS